MVDRDVLALPRRDLAAFGSAVLPHFETPPHVLKIAEYLEAIESGALDRGLQSKQRPHPRSRPEGKTMARSFRTAAAPASRPPADELLTVDELARDWKVKPRTIRAMCARGEVPYIRLGGKLLRFTRADVDRFLQTARIEPRRP